MRKLPSEKFISLFDLHCGQERKIVGGVAKTVPTHSRKAIQSALEFAEYYEPSIVVFGGDSVDAGEISRHNKNKHRLTEGIRFKDGLDMLEEEVLKPVERILPRKCRKIFLTGNHERFIQDFLDENPALEGFVSIEEYLHLADRGFECYDLGELVNIGKLWWTHGEQLMSKYPAHQALAQYRRNIVFGHRHTVHMAIDSQPYDRPWDRHVAKCLPCLRDLNPGWMQNATTNWVQGLHFGEVRADGNFTDFIAVMLRNKLVVDGIEFDGRSLARDLR